MYMGGISHIIHYIKLSTIDRKGLMKIVDVEMSLMRCHPAQAACQNDLLYKKHRQEDMIYWDMINIK